LIRILFVAAGFAVGGVAAVLGSSWLEQFRETVLPTPTGSFPVGRTTLVWSDPAGTDPMAPLPGTRSELIAWIWYPEVEEDR
jgi:hypothetical protein